MGITEMHCIDLYTLLQAQRFERVEDEQAIQIIHQIQNAASPEEAAVLGRRLAWSNPNLVCRCIKQAYGSTKYSNQVKSLLAYHCN